MLFFQLPLKVLLAMNQLLGWQQIPLRFQESTDPAFAETSTNSLNIMNPFYPPHLCPVISWTGFGKPYINDDSLL